MITWNKPFKQGGKWYQYGTYNGQTYVREAIYKWLLVSAKATRLP